MKKDRSGRNRDLQFRDYKRAKEARHHRQRSDDSRHSIPARDQDSYYSKMRNHKRNFEAVFGEESYFRPGDLSKRSTRHEAVREASRRLLPETESDEEEVYNYKGQLYESRMIQ